MFRQCLPKDHKEARILNDGFCHLSENSYRGEITHSRQLFPVRDSTKTNVHRDKTRMCLRQRQLDPVGAGKLEPQTECSTNLLICRDL